jgi:hydrogenase nickel incorporation protein HypA/HybF
MHELGIASSVLEAVKKEVARHDGARPHKVGLRIGEMAAIDQESLRFCFEAITRETEFESLQLEVEFCPRRHRCGNCTNEFVIQDYNFRCPECASLETQCISGDELELAFLEVDEYGTCTAGTKSIE